MTDSSNIVLVETSTENTDAEIITEDLFGGVFVGYRNIDRFDGYLQSINSSLVRWPGGHAAETASWYGLEFDDLVDSGSNKAGLSELLPLVVEDGLALAIVVPTGEYASDPAAGKDALFAFLERLLGGELGPVPQEIILELGNEYYGISEFVNAPLQYGRVANAMLEAISEFQAEHPEFDTILNSSVQFGRNAADNAEILSEMSTTSLGVIDALTYHRYPWTLDDADAFENHYISAFDSWVEAGIDADTDVFVSEWNIASWTRSEALNRFQDLLLDEFGELAEITQTDLEQRNNTNFEHFWQTGELVSSQGNTVQTMWGLQNRDYGLAQASGMLELFSSLLATGADAAALYGIDTGYAGRATFGNQRFVGSAMLEMMSQTLPGTRLVETETENHRDDVPNVFTFLGNGRIVLYVSAEDISGDNFGETTTIDLSDLGYDIEAVSARSLTSTLPSDWMQENGIVDIAGIDETPESRIYEEPVVADVELQFNDDTVDVVFTESFQVFEIILQVSPAEPATETDGADPIIVVGTDGDDHIVGTAGGDEIDAGMGSDSIISGTGNDIISGGGGNDQISVGAGENIVSGGLGADHFLFATTTGTTTVTDFDPSVDRLVFEKLLENYKSFDISIGDVQTHRISCFIDGEPDLQEFLHLKAIQVNNDVLIRAAENTFDLAESDPYIILEGINLNDLSYESFVF